MALSATAFLFCFVITTFPIHTIFSISPVLLFLSTLTLSAFRVTSPFTATTFPVNSYSPFLSKTVSFLEVTWSGSLFFFVNCFRFAALVETENIKLIKNKTKNFIASPPKPFLF